jgi:hypothetical protein
LIRTTAQPKSTVAVLAEVRVGGRVVHRQCEQRVDEERVPAVDNQTDVFQGQEPLGIAATAASV